jgi:hypothetical protein
MGRLRKCFGHLEKIYNLMAFTGEQKSKCLIQIFTKTGNFLINLTIILKSN